MIELYNGNCLEVMKSIPDNSIDLILTDPPYGTSACKWDCIIDFDKLWEQYNRIIKKTSVVCLFGSEPFSTYMRMSNIKNFKYDWIWIKTKSAGFVHAKNMPLKKHEIISVFSNASMGHASLLGDNRMRYYPQGLVEIHREHHNALNKFGGVMGKRPSQKDDFVSEFGNYPTSILEYGNDRKIEGGDDKPHPTQKPVALCEYLIKTYTQKGDVILDNCMGSGTTGVACVNSERDFIGIELNEEYFNTAKSRIERAIEANKTRQMSFFDE